MPLLQGYLHTYEEAYLVVHAVRLGIISPLSKRLSARERTVIKSGSIFVFIRDLNGITRWTDGRMWSSSKISGPFLLYKEHTREVRHRHVGRERHALKQPKNVPLEQQMEQNKFVLHKKTISIKHERNVYHIIAYFQPVFDKWSLCSYPFFVSLRSAINLHIKLHSDHYLDELRSRQINVCYRYNILPFTQANLIPDIDRVFLEQIAKDVLNNKLYLISDGNSSYRNK